MQLNTRHKEKRKMQVMQAFEHNKKDKNTTSACGKNKEGYGTWLLLNVIDSTRVKGEVPTAYFPEAGNNGLGKGCTHYLTFVISHH